MQTSDVVSEALAIQRKIMAELAKQSAMSDKLENILHAFTDSTGSREALLYATVNDNYLEFMGGYHAQNYKNNIRFEEDIIGKSAAYKRSVRDISEAENVSVLSVPVLRLNNTAAVIVLIKGGTEGYSEQQTELVETLALVLPDLLSTKEFIEHRNQIIKEKGIVVRDVLHGTRMNKGYGVGKAVLHRRHRELTNIFAENIELEKSKLAEGRRRMVEYIDSKLSQAGNYLGNTTDIMEAYKMFALDKGWYKKITADERERCRIWMNIFQISELEERDFLELSSGEQRMILLARAFVKNPSLLILDEPLHGLDRRRRTLVMEIIKAFCLNPQKTLIIVTHYPEELPSTIDHTLTLVRHSADKKS